MTSENRSDSDDGYLGRVLRGQSYLVKIAVALGILVLVVSAIGFLITTQTAGLIAADKQDELERSSQVQAQQMDTWLQGLEHETNRQTNVEAVKSKNTSRVAAHLQASQDTPQSVVAIHYVQLEAESATILASTGLGRAETTLVDEAVPWADQGAAIGPDRPFVSSPYTRETGGQAFAMIQRVQADSDRAVVLVIDPGTAAVDFRAPPGGQTFAIDEDGTIVVSTNPEEIGENAFDREFVTRPAFEEVMATPPGVFTTTFTDEVRFDGDQHLTGMTRLSTQNWVTVTQTPESEAFQVRDEVRNLLAVLVASVLFLGFGIVGVLGYTTVRDIRRLSQKARAVEEGNYDVPLETDRTDEIGDAYRSVEGMRDKLLERIRESALVEHSYDLITVIDRDGTITYQSPSSRHIIGFEPNELEGKSFFNMVHEESVKDASRSIEAVDESPAGKQRFEYRLQNADGEWRIFQSVCENHCDDPFVDGFIISSRDVTERKQRERQLEELNTRLELALDETDTGVWEWNLETDDVVWDEASERLFGYDPGEFPETFEGFADRVPDEDLTEVQREIDRALETDGEYRAEFRVLLPDGERRWVHARGVVQYDDSGEPERMLGIQTDITEQKEREQELRETKQELEQSNEKLDQFAGIVSHDLRNPINAAQLRLDLLRHEKADEHIDEIEGSLDRMQTMIEDLLTLSRGGATVEDPEDVSLADVAAESWETAQTDDADFELSVNESTIVQADRDRLRHVFENLFRNAVDHNDSPLTVRVGLLEPSDATTDNGQGGFFIEDDGDGIPEDEHDDIFGHGYTTSDDGTGFGLSIVEDVVEAHGWTISIAKSDEGGARFEITGVEVSDRPTDSWY
jgi:PAS domain S-box-containing protein